LGLRISDDDSYLSSLITHHSYYAAPSAGAQAGVRAGPKMTKMTPLAENAPPGQLAEDYWSQSRRPLASLVFLAPLLVAYEAGVLLLGAQNGADAFLRRLLNSLGFGQHLLLPGLTVCILLGWHYLSRHSWRLSGGILSGMVVECVLAGFCLRGILLLQYVTGTASITADIKESARSCVGFLGAGIYEELLFRLILLSLAAWGLQRLGAAPAVGMAIAAVLTSLLFSAAHHFGAAGEPFQWFSFVFRSLAGLFFSILFVYRGFGIAAGSHAAYDILSC
jgi:hypothetical protein